MTSDDRIRTRFSDLVADQGEEFLPLIGALDNALGAFEPPSTLAVEIRRLAKAAVVQPEMARQNFSPLRLKRSLLVPLAAALAALMIGGTALAADYLINRALHSDAGAQAVASQMTEIGQAQSAAGYRVTVQSGYADANRVVVAYTVAPPANSSTAVATISSATLNDSLGHALPILTTAFAPISGTSGDGLISFDAAGVSGNPAALNLDLAVTQLITIGPNGKTDPSSVGTVSVNLHFAFRVPFNPGRVGDPNLAAASGGKTATLKRIVVTPTETRIHLTGCSACSSPVATWAELKTGTGAPVTANWFEQTSDGVVLGFQIAAPPTGGSWTLTAADKPAPTGALLPGVGTWTFTFQAP